MKLRVAIICALAYFAALRLDIDGALDFIHEGERLAHIDALHDGKLPFRDIYVQHGLGENILKPLLACAWFGTDVAALRKLGSNAFLYRGILPPLGTVTAIIAVATLTRRWQGALVAAALLLLCWVEVTDRHVLGLLALAAAGAFLHSRRRSRLFQAGVLTSFAATYSLDVGLFSLLTIGTWCVADAYLGPISAPRPREITQRLISFLAGTVIGFLPLMLWCVWHDILGDFGLNVSWQLFLRGEAMPATYPRPWQSHDAPDLPTVYAGLQCVMLYYSIPLAAIGVAVFAWRRRSWPAAMRSGLMLMALASLASWGSVLGRPDDWHVAYAAGPFLMLAVVVLLPISSWTQTNWRWAHLKRGSIGVIMMIAPSLIMLMAMGEGGVGGPWRRWTGLGENSRVPARLSPSMVGGVRTQCRVKRVGCDLPLGETRFVETVCGYIQANSRPDETILDLSNSGLLYFLTERRSATRFYLLMHVGVSPRLRAIMADDVLAQPTQPALAITAAGDFFSGAVGDDPLGKLLHAWYEPTDSIGYLQFWKRKGEVKREGRLEKEAQTARP